MKSLKNSKRKISRWKMISIMSNDNTISTCFPLDEYGRLVNKFQKSKPRNLNLLMNPHLAAIVEDSDYTKSDIPSEPEKNSNFDLIVKGNENSEEDQQHMFESPNLNNTNSNSINSSLSGDFANPDFSNLLVSSSLIKDTQWCIDYVTTHLIEI